MNHADAPRQVQSEPAAEEPSRERDRARLKRLMIFHYVLGGVAVGTGLHFLLLSGLWFLGVFVVRILDAERLAGGRGALNPAVGAAVFGAIMILALSLAAWGLLSLAAGRRLRDRRSYGFLLAWSLWQRILLFPLGIPLGVSLRRALRRESVTQLFHSLERT